MTAAVAAGGLASAVLAARASSSRVFATVIDPGLSPSSSARELRRTSSPILSVSYEGFNVKVFGADLASLDPSGVARAELRKIRYFASLVNDELELPSLVYRVDSGSRLWDLDLAQAVSRHRKQLRPGDRLITASASFDLVDWASSLDALLRSFTDSPGAPPLRLSVKRDLVAVRAQAVVYRPEPVSFTSRSPGAA